MALTNTHNDTQTKLPFVGILYYKGRSRKFIFSDSNDEKITVVYPLNYYVKSTLQVKIL